METVEDGNDKNSLERLLYEFKSPLGHIKVVIFKGV
jgi:hypothetical protein